MAAGFVAPHATTWRNHHNKFPPSEKPFEEIARTYDALAEKETEGESGEGGSADGQEPTCSHKPVPSIRGYLV